MRRFVNVAMIHCERYSPLQLGGFFFKCYLIVTFAELTVTKVVCLVLVHQKRLFKFITLLIDFGACFSSLVSMGSESKLRTGKLKTSVICLSFLKPLVSIILLISECLDTGCNYVAVVGSLCLLFRVF